MNSATLRNLTNAEFINYVDTLPGITEIEHELIRRFVHAPIDVRQYKGKPNVPEQFIKVYREQTY